MENKFCKNSAYFRQHYTFDKQRIFRVFCGHCTLKNPTGKKPDAKYAGIIYLQNRLRMPLFLKNF